MWSGFAACVAARRSCPVSRFIAEQLPPVQILGLGFASVVVWTILLLKGATLLGTTLRTRREVGVLAAAEGPEDDNRHRR